MGYVADEIVAASFHVNQRFHDEMCYLSPLFGWTGINHQLTIYVFHPRRRFVKSKFEWLKKIEPLDFIVKIILF